MKQFTGKVTHVGEKNGNVDSILLNVGHSKTLTVKFNEKHFGDAGAPPKGSVVTFSADSIDDGEFVDTKTGEVKAWKYLEASNFKMIGHRMPAIQVVRRSISLSDQQPTDAPHPANDPAQFDQQ